MGKRMFKLAIEVTTLLLFTLLWEHLEIHVEHATELFGVVLIQRLTYNYVHGAAHTVIHKAIHHMMPHAGKAIWFFRF